MSVQVPQQQLRAKAAGSASEVQVPMSRLVCLIQQSEIPHVCNRTIHGNIRFSLKVLVTKHGPNNMRVVRRTTRH